MYRLYILTVLLFAIPGLALTNNGSLKNNPFKAFAFAPQRGQHCCGFACLSVSRDGSDASREKAMSISSDIFAFSFESSSICNKTLSTGISHMTMANFKSKRFEGFIFSNDLMFELVQTKDQKTKACAALSNNLCYFTEYLLSPSIGFDVRYSPSQFESYHLMTKAGITAFSLAEINYGRTLASQGFFNSYNRNQLTLKLRLGPILSLLKLFHS